MRILSLLFVFITIVSCSSRKLKKDYLAIDASHQEIPEWVSDLDEWLDDEEKNFKKNRYYIYTTEAKNSRTTACEIAKARSTASVAAEVSSFIKQSFAQAKNGDPTASSTTLSEYVEDNLAKEVQAYITGVQSYKDYWEKRRFTKKLGAKKEWDGYVCTSLAKISKKNLEKAFDRARKALAAQTRSDLSAKRQVEEIMQEASKAYLK